MYTALTEAVDTMDEEERKEYILRILQNTDTLKEEGESILDMMILDMIACSTLKHAIINTIDWERMMDNLKGDSDFMGKDVLIYDDTVLTGVNCKKCGNDLPPHTAAEHLAKAASVPWDCPHK